MPWLKSSSKVIWNTKSDSFTSLPAFVVLMQQSLKLMWTPEEPPGCQVHQGCGSVEIKGNSLLQPNKRWITSIDIAGIKLLHEDRANIPTDLADIYSAPLIKLAKWLSRFMPICQAAETTAYQHITCSHVTVEFYEEHMDPFCLVVQIMLFSLSSLFSFYKVTQV